nr:lytic murein transglycosylase [Rhizomicrobium palustre]
MALIAASYGAQGATISGAAGVPVPTPSPLAEDQAFQAFLLDFRPQALAAGISAATYDQAVAGISRNQKVEDRNLNQPEFSKPIWAYLDSAVSPRRVSDGRAAMSANEEAISKISTRYGVPAEILTSIWGNESDYGRGAGSYKMVEALATLAYAGPRIDYARPQLLAALKMAEQEHYDPAAMTSSWAGAFGQTQFVPTTFLSSAVDGDGDGRIDLWLNVADALASTANVLSRAGWVAGKPWGYEVTLPPGFAYEEADLDITKPVSAWTKAGVKTAAGTELPQSGDPASLFLPAGARGPAFLVFPNFKSVLKYNNAASYALAVCLLGDQLKAAAAGASPTAPVAGAWPRDLAPLSRDERLALQDSLTKLGFDIGKVDGLIGAKSRAAVRAWQKAHALPADGFATAEILTQIAMEAKSKTATP